ncbi:MAG: hypothetical protein WBQ95_13780 [Terracidiphilus sp.]
MRWLVLIGILVLLALPAYSVDSHPTEKLTVAQLEQIIAQRAAQPREPAKKRATASDEIIDISDGDLLQQLDQDDELIPRIAATELTERLSTITMYHLIGKYNLGAHVQQALEQLADRSALLKLPPGEQLNKPPPDAETQKAMLQQSRAYVLSELSHLPNFVANQTTTRFDDSPTTLKYFQTMTDHAGFHRVGTLQRTITFQDGKEVTASPLAINDPKRKDIGLESRGEFGTEAAVVLMDVEKGSIVFDHWEQSMAGPVADYRYSVPRESSHYEVTDACQDHVSFHDLPGYSGEIALDSRSGAILRMTLVTESNPGDPVSHVASVIEYGPVVLGNRRSICPLRSLTFMVEEVNGCAHGNHKLQKPVAMINQTIFSNYHRFGSSATIIFDEAQNGHTAPGGSQEKPASGGEKTAPATPLASQPNRRP